MGTWLTVSLAWLAGVAWQTDAAALQPLWVYGATVLGCALLAGWAWRMSAGTAGASGTSGMTGTPSAPSTPSAPGTRTMASPVPGRRPTGLAQVAPTPVWRRWAPRALAMLAVAALAWASTGWRATDRIAERIPAAWQGQDVPVIVRVTGLPRLASAGGPAPPVALFDAEVEAWWPDHDAGTGGKASPSSGCCLPRKLAVSMPMREGHATMPRAGQRWRLEVRLHEPDGPSNPGAFDPTLSYFERGIRAMARVPAKARPLLLSARPYWPWQGAIDRLRQDTRDRIFALIPDPRAAGVLAGLSVGDQSAIDREDWEVFRRAGLGHVVSISGTHIAMLGWLAAWLALRLWSRWHGGMHRWTASSVALWAGVAASVLYALLAGWGVPAQRTVWMMAIVACMRTGGRRWPWPLVWLGSAVVLTVLDPWCLRQAGFWLSYVAVGVLMSQGLSPEGPSGRRRDDPMRLARHGDGAGGWTARAIEGLRTGGQAAGQATSSMLSSQWLVTKALLPLVLVCFGQVSLIGFAANAVAIPIFTLGITPLALLGMVFEPCWTLGAWLIQQIMSVLGWMAGTPYATSDLPALPMWLAALAVLAGWSVALRMDFAWRLAFLPFALVLMHVPDRLRLLPAPADGHFQVLAVDIGQGTAVLVRTRHRNLLFDTGPRLGADNDAGDRILVPLLRTLGIRSLDTLLISHEDTDHVGGAPSVLRQVPVARLLTSLDAQHPLRAMPGVHGHVVPHTACEAGQGWTWDGVSFRILHPVDEDYARRASAPGKVAPNAMSCVLQVRAAHRRGGAAVGVLVAGDIGKAEEAVIMARADEADSDGDPAEPHGEGIQSTLLIAPHHGSNTSSSSRFLEAVAPDLVVIQAGRRNRYGHPARAVTARYDAMRIPWVATPACGAFLWSSDATPRYGQGGTGPPIGECWRHGHRHYWQGALPDPH